jgi:Ca-activated chloride channel family protein
MTERDLIRRLEDQPTPPPPENLLERLVEDIPETLEVDPAAVQDTNFVPFRRRRWLYAAAAVLTLTLTGTVTWQMQRGGSLAPQLADLVGEEAAVDETKTAKIPYVVKSEKFRSAPAEEDAEGTTSESGVADDQELGRQRQAIRSEVRQLLIAPDGGGAGRRDAPAAPAPSPGSVGEAKTYRVPIGDPTPNEPEPEYDVAPLGAADRKREETRRQARPASDGSMQFQGEVEVVGEYEERAPALALSPVEIVDESGTVSRIYGVPEGSPPPGADPNSASADRDGRAKERKKAEIREGWQQIPAPSTGGTAEPNDQPYGDVFFEHTGVNPFVDTDDDHLSTFGLDVDTGSYTVARRYLADGHLPPHAAIRVEEFVNAMDYGIEPPRRDDFRLVLEGAPSLHAPGERYLTLRLAVKAREVDAEDRPPALLIFCVDVSGSMNQENRLGLVKRALRELLGELRSDDRVGLVVYGSSGRVLMEPTRDLAEIERGIQRLSSGGSTNAEEGLRLAYRMARDFRDEFLDGDEDELITRIILCSDGVANVGNTGPDSILESVRRSADEGIELTTVGFGMGNYNDALMEQLADAGDGRYAYVDALDEARRLFVTELTGTLYTVAREARAQVEFDSETVTRWRLVGYENRDIADERFRDPTVDAGEIGAGHTVTAVYQVKLAEDAKDRDRLATLRLRYRPADSERFREVEESLRLRDVASRFARASEGLRLAAVTADFAEVLKGSYWARSVDLQRVAEELRDLNDPAAIERVEDLEWMVRRADRLLRDRAGRDDE